MGGGQSKDFAHINEDEYARRYQSILQNFVVEKQCSDKIYGNCIIYRYKKQDLVFRIAEVVQFYLNEQSMKDGFQSSIGQMENSSHNLLKIHMCRQSVEDSLCSTNFKVYKLYDFIEFTLEDKIQKKIQSKDYFTEEELWSLLEQMVSALAFMEEHQYLRADTIFIVHQINDQNLYKLFYKGVLNYKSNFEDCQKGKYQGRYLPVDGLKHLKENETTYSDYVQQDKFALGMIILQCANLESLDCCYDYKNYEFNYQLQSEKFNLMRNSNRYSQDLCRIVLQLLQQEDNEFYWPTFNAYLTNLNLPCGPRIQDSYQNIKLENLPPIIDIPPQNGQGNASLNPQNNNNPVTMNQSQNHGTQQGNFGAHNEIGNQQDQNQIFNNSPQNNLQNGLNNVSTYINSGNTGNFNQLQSLALGHQHTLSHPSHDLNIANNLHQSIINNPYNPSTTLNNNIFGSPQTNTLNANHAGGLVNQHSIQNSIHNQVGLNHSPNNFNMNGNLSNHNNHFPQISQNNNSIHQQNHIQPFNINGNINNNMVDQTQLLQLLVQLTQQVQQQQQYIGGQPQQESFYQSNNHNTSLMNYSPLRGANIFNQFNQRSQKMYTENDLNKSYSAFNGVPRRRAQMQYDDGSFYDGEMVMEYRDGFGKLIFSNKGVYEGTWKLNKMHGKGIIYYPNGEVAYEGDWFEDQFNNFGHLYNAKAQNTKQKFDFKDFSSIKNFWLKYEGEFILDRKQGFGTLYFTNGERYCGNFKNDAIHGHGVFYQQDGESFSGYWEENLLIKRV